MTTSLLATLSAPIFFAGGSSPAYYAPADNNPAAGAGDISRSTSGGVFCVGLTGGLASGKSSAADEFEQLGATIIDADKIARTITEPGGAGVAAVREALGDWAVDDNGGMARDEVRKRVFAGDESISLRHKLEGALHPLIAGEMQEQLQAAAGCYAVAVVPLLFETGIFRSQTHRTLNIDCPEELQLARSARRGGMSEGEARAVLAAQMPRAQRCSLASDIIENTTTLAALHTEVRRLHSVYLKIMQHTAELS